MPLKRPFAEFPRVIDKWTAVKDHSFDEKTMAILRVDDFIFRSYREEGNVVLLYIGYYRSQREGVQIHSPKHCLPGSGWFKLSEKVRMIQSEYGAINFVETIYQKDLEKKVFLYWYDMQGNTITNEYLLKLSLIYNSLKNNRSDAAFIRISTPVLNNNVENAITVAERFLRNSIPVIKSFLPET